MAAARGQVRLGTLIIQGDDVEMNVFSTKSHRAFLMLMFGAVAMLVVSACGGEGAEPTATVDIPPVGGEPTQPSGDGTSEAATATPQDSGTPGEPPVGSRGVTVTSRIEPPIFRVNLSGRGFADALLTRFGVFETLLRADYRPLPEYGPIGGEGIATSWDIEDDFSKITFTLREGVPFHGDWGELTAEDVAFSFNDALAENSIFTRATPFGEWMDHWEVVDDRTVELHLKYLEPTWATKLSNASDTAAPIVSKAAFDELGSEEFNVTDMGTGPFTVRTWDTGNRMILDRFDDYFRVNGRARVPSITYVSMPEQSVQTAAMETGEVDIATGDCCGMNPILVRGAAERTGGEIIGVGPPNGATIKMAGNFWATEYPDTGEPIDPFPRPGFQPDEDHPWIGDPWGDGNSMESARLVRHAMALAIDRDLLVEAAADGLGVPAYAVTGFVPGEPHWQEEWFIPYDPDRAIDLLAEAGYPDGFSLTYWQGIEQTAFLAEPIAQMWEDIGLRVSIDSTAYDAYRPRFVDRSLSIPYMHGIGKGTGPDTLKMTGSTPTFGGGDSVEMTDEMSALAYSNRFETDPEQRIENNIELQDWLSHWMLHVPTMYDNGNLYVVNQGIEWTPHQADFGFFNSPETIVVTE